MAVSRPMERTGGCWSPWNGPPGPEVVEMAKAKLRGLVVPGLMSGCQSPSGLRRLSKWPYTPPPFQFVAQFLQPRSRLFVSKPAAVNESQ